jgi:3-oxoacyl-[acyl-carrier-protein] synthase II
MNAVITQSDVVTAYGWGMDALWNGLLSGQTAIRSTDRFAERGFVSDQAAMVPDLQVEQNGSRVMAMLRRLLSPLIGQIDSLTPLILATTVGEIEYVERAILDGQPDLAAEGRPQTLLGRIKQLLQLRGAAMVISSACASSAAAVTRATTMIWRGETPAVLVVGCDAVSEFVYSGFSSLLSLSACPARPFDTDHDGLSLGEGAAWALLVGSETPQGRGRATRILGWGNTTDTVHMTAPDRNGAGLSRAIRKACERAGRSADDVSFIAAHGTGTVFSDEMEMTAFREVFREPRPTFSIKGGMGHAMGAAGLVQLLVAHEAITRGIVPPTVGLTMPGFQAGGWVSNQRVELPAPRVAVSTSSGFGGVNTAILVAGRAGP